MPNTAIIIVTTSRPEICDRLLQSIAKFAPEYTVLIKDDTTTDNGLSKSRNELVKQANTKYVLVLDDDCVFTNKTQIALLEKEMDKTGCDIMGFTVYENGIELGYRGRYITDDNVVRFVTGEPLEFVPGIFIARRESLLQYPWDEKLKIGEHFAFFYEHRGKLKIGYCRDTSIDHAHVGNPEYNKLRSRAISYVQSYMIEKGIKERIDLNGEHLMAK